MHVRKSPVVFTLIWIALGLPVDGPAKAKNAGATATAPAGAVVLWTDPTDLKSRNLFYGPGGSGHVPHGPYTFVKEDMDGTNPKFVVKDADGTKWKVKMGNEARPETVASRLVWAVGYYANEDYLVPELQVGGMPARLHRGAKLVGPNGTVRNVRLKREDYRKIGTWPWRGDPFTGTRELNGLRTLMAVINNWDLKDENNSVYEQSGERLYVVSDLGASFGCPDRCLPKERAKGDLGEYSRSKFIRQVTPDTVSFQTPSRPDLPYLVNPKEYWQRVHLEWIGRKVPRADARWMGQLLACLSKQQIQDAFRAAGYSPQDVDAFTGVLQSRIAALTNL
jgi:hypothetical protein